MAEPPKLYQVYRPVATYLCQTFARCNCPATALKRPPRWRWGLPNLLTESVWVTSPTVTDALPTDWQAALVGMAILDDRIDRTLVGLYAGSGLSQESLQQLIQGWVRERGLKGAEDAQAQAVILSYVMEVTRDQFLAARHR